MINLGTVRPGSTIYIPFDTFAGSTGASVTQTGLAVTDIEIYKDGSMTQRASDSGYTLLDTDGIDIDSITGIHGFSISLADNTTAGFWAAGSRYYVVVSSITVDSQTVNFVAATFDIGYPDAFLNTTIATLSSQTSFTLTVGPAEDDALNGCVVLIHDVASAVQLGFAVVSDYTGSTKTVTLTAGVSFTAAATDNVSIYPPSNKAWSGRNAPVAQTGNDDGADINEILTDTGTTLQAELDGIQADTEDLQTQIGTDGAGLTNMPWNAAWDTEVQSEVQDAIEANHLDHLLAADYDPASKPGTATALLNELVENDGGVSRFTTNALEQGPSGSGASAASIADAVWDELVADHVGAGSTGERVERLDIIASGGSGGLTNARAALLDNADAAISTRATPADVNAQVLDVLNVDTFPESSGVPAATSTLIDKIKWLFTLSRNKITQTATTQTLRNDADSGNVATSTDSDNGTTYTRGEWS